MPLVPTADQLPCLIVGMSNWTLRVRGRAPDHLRQTQGRDHDLGGGPYYIPAGASDHTLGGLISREGHSRLKHRRKISEFLSTLSLCAPSRVPPWRHDRGFCLAQKQRGSWKWKSSALIPPKKLQEIFDNVQRIPNLTAVKSVSVSGT